MHFCGLSHFISMKSFAYTTSRMIVPLRWSMRKEHTGSSLRRQNTTSLVHLHDTCPYPQTALILSILPNVPLMHTKEFSRRDLSSDPVQYLNPFTKTFLYAIPCLQGVPFPNKTVPQLLSECFHR